MPLVGTFRPLDPPETERGNDGEYGDGAGDAPFTENEGVPGPGDDGKLDEYGVAPLSCELLLPFRIDVGRGLGGTLT